MVTREDFVESLNALAKEGAIKILADLHTSATGDDKALIEQALIAGIEICGTRGQIDAVVNMLGREGLSDSVRAVAEKALIAGIGVCGTRGWVDPVVALFEEGLSEAVMEKAEKALIAGIGVCGSKGRVDAVADVLERKGLSDGVLIAGIEVCGS